MILVLVIVVSAALAISFLCSLMEAALLTVSLPYLRYLAESGSKRAKIMLNFKEKLGEPIAAILILNTVSHTLGASIAGSIVSVYGDRALIGFSVIFTILVLFVSEIVPKKLGSDYNRQVSLLIAIPLQMLITLLYPLIYVTEIFSKKMGNGAEEEPKISHEEVLSMAELGKEEGVIDSLEDSVIRNVIGLDTVLVRDILTPRVVVLSFKEGLLVSTLRDTLFALPHSRIPVFPDNDLDEPSGYVTQRDIAKALLSGCQTETIKDLIRPIDSVPDTLRVDKLMLQMVDRQVPICAVINEHGGFAGVVTLEDILEEILGSEIVDEFDEVRDLRSYAKTLHELKKPEFKS